MKRVFVLPITAALILTLGGAMNWGPRWGRENPHVIVDRSDSCAAPDVAGTQIRDSRLGAALAWARQAGSRHVVLYTDGCDPDGLVAVPPDLRVDVVLCPRRDDIGVKDLAVPRRIPPGADFAVEIELRRTRVLGADPVEIGVRLLRDGAEVGGVRRVVLASGQSRRIRVPDRVDTDGVVRYRAELVGQAGAPANDAREAVAVVGTRPRILSLAGPVAAPDLDVTVRKRISDPTAYDAVLLDKPPTAGQQRALLDAVRVGTGLVVLGGAGYAGDPLDSVLPLTDRPPGGRATVVLLDFSGSMTPRKKALVDGVRQLLLAMAPDDRVAAVVFNDDVRSVYTWTEVRTADWDFSPRPQGATYLVPALKAAARLFREAGSVRTRRLFVVTDGEWKDAPDIPAALVPLVGATRVALFVKAPAPPLAHRLFPRALDAGSDLAAELRQLEDLATERVKGDGVVAEQGEIPDWLAGAVPPAGRFPGGFSRLYAKGRGEAVALAAGDIPLLGAERRGGKVVVAATGGDPAALLRACVRENGGVRIRTRREGRALRIDVYGIGAAAGETRVLVGDRPLTLRLVTPDHAEAVLDPAPPEPVVVRVGPAAVLAPAAGSSELDGTGPNEALAAAIARASGGKLYHSPEAPAARARPQAAITLLLAAVLIVVGAAFRRSS